MSFRKFVLGSWRSVFGDVFLAVVFLLAATAAGHLQQAHISGSMPFYQDRMGPAVMWAAGRGYVNPDVTRCQPLRDFLALKAPALDPATLPADLPTTPPTPWQLKHRYQYMAIALAWRTLGISWASLYPMFALFYGATVAAAFGIFRLGMGRILAAIGAALILMSPIHLAVLPVFRDYSKAPFLLAIFLTLGLMLHAGTRRRFWLLCAACGMATGLGLGFRSDLFVAIPPFLATALLFARWKEPCPAEEDAAPGAARKVVRHIATEAVGIILYAICCLVPAWPSMAATTEESNGFHISLLGLTESFDDMLGVSPMPYTFCPFYNDEYIVAAVNARQQLTGRGHDLLRTQTQPFEREGAALFLGYIRHFPADILVRIYAATLRLLDEVPFCDLERIHNGFLERGNGAKSPALLAVYAARYHVLSLFQGTGRYLLAAALLVLAARRFRLALFGLAFVLYFCGYTVLQFAPRHIFHMEFLSLWALGFLLHTAWRAAWGLPALRDAWRDPVQRRARLATLQRPAVRMAAFALVAALGLAAPLAALRVYQASHLRALTTAIAQAPVEPITIRTGYDNAGVMYVQPQGLFTRDDDMVQAHCLAIDLDIQAPGPLDITQVYEADLDRMNWTCPLKIAHYAQIAPGRVRLVLPVYKTRPDFWQKAAAFLMLAFKDPSRVRVAAVGRFTNLDILPMPLYWLLPAQPAYQTLTR